MKKEIGAGLGLAAVVFLGLQGVSQVVPFLILAAILTMLYLMAQGRLMGGRSFATTGSGSAGSLRPIDFDAIGGQQVAKRELKEALDFLRKSDEAAHLGIRPLKGILLVGPPGTGKTLMARAAASYTQSVFLAASGSQFVEMYAGVGAQRIRHIFNQARRQAEQEGRSSAIIFIDEMEVLGGKRGKHASHLEYDQTLNELLVQMDGIAPSERVRLLVIGATNRPDLLDSALLRPGRFDRTVRVDLPDKEGRRHILEIHAQGKPLAPDVDLDELARETYGFSGAHLESLLNEAAILAMRQGDRQIGGRHLREAVDKVLMGEKLDRRPSEAERRRVAYHETGHAFVSELGRPGSVSTVTLSPRGQALGYMRQTPEDDPYLYTQEELEHQIDVCLGGAVAEELFFGSRSTGAMGDFEQAVGLARRMILAGMSSLGIVSEETLPEDHLHQETVRILKGREGYVREVLTAHRPLMDRAAVELLREEKLPGARVRDLLRPPAAEPLGA
ncbi:AAA family ATPase [Limnochorda pilosa]|uniref:Microtubule-severing ATPase n=1 Tax=Limnochorda pilosa TaxID=1555112 RepID=A0A0K2SLG6_LIMPI|nr:AAA family ATPase [Limnochorda pilosa]BAS27659.1 microtubule-severing ATPase [Limnochorda pilosa]